MNREIAYIKLPKVCRECKEFIYPPFNENLYIITKDNKHLEVCKSCHAEHKGD